MELTKELLAKFIPGNPYIDHWYDALSKLLPDYEINTPQRIAAFMAECIHESAGFTALAENLNYKPETLLKVFPHYFQTEEIAQQYGHHPEMIANRAYANRMGNGPEESGDGWAHCGRGLIQLTGKDNYQAFADSIATPIEQIPEYLQTFEGACQSACWFWENNNLNALADQGNIDKISQITNGGKLGLKERHQNYDNELAIIHAHIG
jgi:putative chitinase